MQCSSCGTEIEFSIGAFYCPSCGRLISSDERTTGISYSTVPMPPSPYSTVLMPPFPSMGSGPSPYEGRNPYAYNPYVPSACNVDVSPQALHSSQTAPPERGVSHFIKTHVKLVILVTVLIFWASLPALAVKPPDTPIGLIDSICVLLFLIFWPTSLILALYQTARLKRWRWFVCILLLSPIISIGSFIYVLMGPTTFRRDAKSG
jgi:hypothetical protein